MSLSSTAATSSSAGRLVIGTAALGMPYGLPDPSTGVRRALTDDEAEALVHEAVSCGLRVFDTAPDYGCAEERLGRALSGTGTVWSKITAERVSAGEAGLAARLALDASLGRLRRQHIDLLQWHNWTRERLDDDRFVAAWQALSADSRCVALGASTYGPDDALAAVESGQFAVVQVEWNVLNQSAVRAAAAAARQRGVKLAARSVLLQGVLTNRGRQLPPYLRGLAPWRDRVESLARSLGMDLATLSLRAALENPDLSYVVVGVDAPGQAGEHLAAAAVPGPALPWPAIEELHADCDLTDPRRWTGAARQAVSQPG